MAGVLMWEMFSCGLNGCGRWSVFCTAQANI